MMNLGLKSEKAHRLTDVDGRSFVSRYSGSA
jgi:hypothetical protein